MNKYLFYSIIFVAIYFAGYFTHVKLHTCPIPEVQIDTVIQYEIVIDEKIIPVFKVRVEKDTVYSTDTLIIDKTQYIAQMDTVYKDSLLALRVQYISPSPLDKRSYFNIDARVKEKIITNTVYNTETITYNPTFFIDGGVRIDTTLNYFIGAGVNIVSYKHLEVPLKYEYSTNTQRPNHSVEASIKIKF
jgi:hypothetical protein